MKPRHSASVGSSAIAEVSDIYLTLRISLVRVLSFLLCTLCVSDVIVYHSGTAIWWEREREIERPSVYDSGNDESSSTSKSVPIVSTRGALAKGKCHYHTLSTMCFAVGRLALRIYSTKYLSSLFILSHSSSLSLFFSDTCILNVETKRERVGKSGD